MELACKSFIHVLLWKTLPCSFHSAINCLYHYPKIISLCSQWLNIAPQRAQRDTEYIIYPNT
ncbi:MAG: hypothetical protein PWQ06_2216 [Anaerophaga sp.]|nr:hypothetical protein [Anaerophaga sp.]